MPRPGSTPHRVTLPHLGVVARRTKVAYDTNMGTPEDSTPSSIPDPFASPQAVLTSQPLDFDHGAGATFRSPRSGVLLGLGLSAGISVLEILGLVHQIYVIQAPNTEMEVLERSDNLMGVLSILATVTLLSTIILWGMWAHRAASNLRALRPNEVFTYTPAAQIWWYFVPFANLVQPFRAMRELYSVSHLAAGQSFLSIRPIELWWGAWLTSNILANASLRLTPSTDLGDPTAFISRLTLVSALGILSSAASVFAAWAAIQLIQRINGLQTESRRRR